MGTTPMTCTKTSKQEEHDDVKSYPVGFPAIDLIALYECATSKRKFEIARKRFDNFLNACNNVAEFYARHFPSKTNTVRTLRNEILNNVKGVGVNRHGIEADNGWYEDTSSLQASVNRYICKPYYRALAKKFHPDKGGDTEVFSLITKAYKEGDIEALRRYEVELLKGLNLYWKQSDGKTFWQQQERKLIVKLEILKTQPLFPLMRLHAAGRKDDAKNFMSDFLDKKASVLLTELHNTGVRS